ncbi:MAG: molybdenum cofactor biosynthesis protein MoaE [Deltaproteobacteria bacterium]|nr:molybdenum cofactor biosynthesis protein MoaE [Deltaproteobacteria bacterium]
MKVQLLYFAVVRERLGLDEEHISLPADATVSTLLRRLSDLHFVLAPLLPKLSVAVNRSVVPHSTPLHDGDEVALLPPVAGGSGLARVAMLDTPLSLDAVVSQVMAPSQGGLVTFTGVVRDHGQQAQVVRLEYEAFVPMALQVLSALADEVEAQWPGTRVAMHHRRGHLNVGDLAVIIAVSAPHRAEAFAACRACIDRLKERAPIWKKEIGVDGSEWIGLGP